MVRGKRISVRIDEALATKLKALIASSGDDLSALVTEALQRLCNERAPAGTQPYQAWLASGFIGCAEGPGDLSTRCEEYLKEDLNRKYSRK